jgi:hypothetical protein
MDVDSGEQNERPSARRVLDRALCLSAVAMRGIVEGDPQAGGLVQRAREWVKARALDAELEDDERRLLATPLGKAQRQAAVNASWRSEGLCVLAWALGVSEMPAHDEQIDPAAVSRSIGFLSDSPPVRELRSNEELEWMERRLFGLHWRFREFQLQRRPMDFVAFSKDNWFNTFDISGIPVAERDLAIKGLPIAKAPVDHVSACQSIAMERHQAINWLMGADPIYSGVDTST